MKIAITGASGFLGSYLVEKLLQNQNNELFLYSRIGNTIKDKTSSSQRVNIIVTDYSKDSLKKSFECYDSLIHLAGRVFNKENNCSEYYEDNIKISKNIFDTCLKYGVKNIVSASSRILYDNSKNDGLLLENQEIMPKSHYGKSKYEVEKLAQKYNLNIKSLRLGIIFGKGQRDGFMIPSFIEKSKEKKPIMIYGNEKRSSIYVKDAVEAIISAIKTPKARGVFNISDGKSYNAHDIAKLSIDVFSNGIGEIFVDENLLDDQSNYQMSIEKAKIVLNWNPIFPIKEAFEDMKILQNCQEDTNLKYQ